MKKSLAISAILVTFAGAASAAPYVLPSPQPGALTPYDWQPVYAIDGIYSFSENDKPDTYGFRGSFNLYSNAAESIRHQFSLNVTPTWGSEHYHFSFRDVAFSYKIRVSQLPVTLGYDLNIELAEDIFLDLGAKAGYTWNKATIKSAGFKNDFDMNGFTYSVGAGIKVQCSDAIYAKVGYEFGRSFLDTHGIKGNINQHSIVAGVGVQF